MMSRTGTIIDVASSCTVSTSGISIVSSVRGGVGAARPALLLALRSLSSSSSFSRSFLRPFFLVRARAIARTGRTADGVGVIRNGQGAGSAWGRAQRPASSGGTVRCRRAPRRERSIRARRGRRRRATFAALSGHASPGRGATPGRPGSPRAARANEAALVGGGGARRTTEGWPAGTGRSGNRLGRRAGPAVRAAAREAARLGAAGGRCRASRRRALELRRPRRATGDRAQSATAAGWQVLGTLVRPLASGGPRFRRRPAFGVGRQLSRFELHAVDRSAI